MSKKKYSDDYISYCERGDSCCVYITRDVVRSIKTDGKWIDVLDIEGGHEKYFSGKLPEHTGDPYLDSLNRHRNAEHSFYDNGKYRWVFKSFDVELFPRLTEPDYSWCTSEADRKYETWSTAHDDIDTLRYRGYHGPKFRIYPWLVQEKHKIGSTVVKAAWNKKFEQWVPDKWFNEDCEWRERTVPQDYEYGDWVYHIRKIERLN